MAPPSRPTSLSSPRDFKRVYAEGKKARRDGVLVYAAPGARSGPSRLGLSVGTRVGNAVVRNKLRRRLRNLFRAAAAPEGFDVVIVADPSAAANSFSQLEAALRSALAATKAAR